MKELMQLMVFSCQRKRYHFNYDIGMPLHLLRYSLCIQELGWSIKKNIPICEFDEVGLYAYGQEELQPMMAEAYSLILLPILNAFLLYILLFYVCYNQMFYLQCTGPLQWFKVEAIFGLCA